MPLAIFHRLHPEVLIHREVGELDSTDARDDISDGPLVSKDAKKFEAGGTGPKAISDGERGFDAIIQYKKFRLKKIGMVGRMEEKDFVEIKRFITTVPVEPPLIGFFFGRINPIPLLRFSVQIRFCLDQLVQLLIGWKSTRLEIRFRDHDGFCETWNI